tara:strand:+ start:483 stop:1208 length:726 start_codon:yes stop_codon:yes gene_type:complete
LFFYVIKKYFFLEELKIVPMPNNYWVCPVSGGLRQDSTEMDEREMMQGISETLRSHSFENSPVLNRRFREYLSHHLPNQIDRELDLDPLKEFPLLKCAKEYLENDGWTFELLESHSTIAFGFEGNNGKWHCMIQTREKENQLIFYSSLENGVSQLMIENLMRFITIVNYRLVVGNFELDISDGELNYKTALDLDGIESSQALIRNIIHTNLATFDRHLPGIQSILDGSSVDSALDIIELTK